MFFESFLNKKMLGQLIYTVYSERNNRSHNKVRSYVLCVSNFHFMFELIMTGPQQGAITVTE